ncbi:unnamed protein product [Cuscuta epithymum]|uniref:Uncharacterized protein n=1 Tax=Cuscuta epithymum TaxID=186058 RepID=A0AAV0CER7_9ASTE|nr:unnamed protein product [Cuscuta epithymum]
MTSSDGGAMKSGGQGRNRQMLKKGPWTTAEDAILMEYVKKHGEGNWNAVQRNSGLMRCGKSCRLRWANHLRPNLRKGAFSPEEERLIVQLHSKLGNKWARMAAQLPGRTDNEIKNYWNTRLKRRQRAGLPIYPQEIQPQNSYYPNAQILMSTSSSSPLSALLSAPPPPPKPAAAYNPSMSIYDYMLDRSPAALKSPAPPPHTHNSHHFKFFTHSPHGGLALTLASSSSSAAANKHFGPAAPLPFPFSSLYPTFAGGGFFAGPTGMNTQEQPSIQTAVQTTAAAPVRSSGSLYPAAPTDEAEDDDCDEADHPDLSRRNSGLLDELLRESHSLARVLKNYSPDGNGKHKSTIGNQEVVLSFGCEETREGGVAAGKESNNNSCVMDEDIMCLLDNFPLAVQAPPDWYEDGDEDGNGDFVDSASGGDVADAVRNHKEDSKSSSSITTSETTLCWNNMPCIS